MKTSPFLDEIRAEGQQEGRKEGTARAIVHVLQLRFQRILPPEIFARLRETQDENRLSAWLDAAVLVNKVEEFQAELAKD